MRLLGIDFGSKRVGLALTDESGRMAFPYEVYESDSELLKRVVSLIEEKNVEKIILGYSVDRGGKPNIIHKAAKGFMGKLTQKTGLPIELEPEQYTTKEAIRTQGRTEKTDASAAAIILNSYLARKTNES